MEVESGSEAMDSCDEVPEAKRRKLSADADLDLDAMKVKDLKDALEERGLDSKGVKAVLKERLMEALAKENAADSEAGAASDADAASDGEKENVDVTPKEKIA